MTFISRKTRLLVPHLADECDPGYLYHVNRKRSDGRLKRHSSCDDLRAWVDDEYLNYQYFLELMSDGELQERPFLGLMGRFIPIEAILDVLCGKASDGGDKSAEWGIGGVRVAGLKPKPNRLDLNDSAVSEATDDLLKLADAAITKLEAIRCIIYTGYRCNGVSREEESGSGENDQTASKECVNQSTSATDNAEMEEYGVEYNKTVTKIACLRQRLDSIQERRDELNAKIQSSRQTECQPSSDMAVTELYNREEQSYVKRLQKKIEKLIAEKGEVLQEMCTSLKYLNELKKSHNRGDKQNVRGCSCACSKIKGKSDIGGRHTPREREDSVHGFAQEKRRGSKDSFLNKLGRECNRETRTVCRKCAQHPMNETLSSNRESSQVSSEATFVSVDILPVCDSQWTYNIPSVRESIPDRKFKSETSMMEVEQTLRSYEQRLSELTCLESEVEELKKNGAMAEYFKKRWLRSMMRGRCQRTAEEGMKREMEELYQKNCELKHMLRRIAAESEKEYNEMQRLRCKAIKLVAMQEEMEKLKNEINGYQLSCESQNECIGRLEKTIREQRDEIDRLVTHMTRLCRMTEKLREVRKPIKKNAPRSRSYGPERQSTAPRNPRSFTAPEEEQQHAPCCACRRYTDVLNRPKSECGRRMPDRCQSPSHQQTCRNQSCCN